MKCAVKFYNQITNPASAPGDWPAVLIELPDDAEVPAEYTAMSSDELAAYKLARQQAFDAWLNACLENELPKLKQLRYQQINERTDELIARGFEYSGLTFNLSVESQIRFHSYDYSRTLLSYPIKWRTLDDADQLLVADADMMHAFFLAALDALRTSINSGTALKEQIANAATRAEVDVVVDTR